MRGARDRDPASTEEIVHVFWGRIGGVACAFQRYATVNRGELMQAGVAGLLTAVARYDPTRGTPFWAYASWWVRLSMQQLVAELARPVVLSDRAARQLARLKEARRTHVQEHGREPSTEELRSITGFTSKQIASIVAVELAPRALEEPRDAGDDSAGTLGELIADPAAGDEYEHVLTQIEIEQLPGLQDTLCDRERAIVSARYGLGRRPQTLREIGWRLGLSAERVRQIEEQALEKLRTAACGSP